jgi:hypothetical protein
MPAEVDGEKKLVEIGEEETRSTREALWKGSVGINGFPLLQVAEKEFRERTELGRGLVPI